MPEIHDNKKVYSLLELGQSIERMFDTHYRKRYWVKAELHKLNLYGRSGHCFPDMVEKRDGQVIAEMRGTIWRADYQRINNRFVSLLGEPLKEGIKVLCHAAVSYSVKYGLTLHISDIDVEYTLGDLAKERKETISRLTAEGVFDANKQLPTPVLPKRLAVISVETSNGYADFIKVLDQNDYGYRFEQTLFPSLLQGDRAIATMIRQLNAIARRKDEFDMVAIIRGGGGDIGLSFLNNYELAQTVATFPLPVMTGIGHATNQTVVELVAHVDSITPTKMAQWLVQKFRELEVGLDRAATSLERIPREILFGARQELHATLRFLGSETRRQLDRSWASLREADEGLPKLALRAVNDRRKTLDRRSEALGNATSELIESTRIEVQRAEHRLVRSAPARHERERERLHALARQVHSLHPDRVLQRGYSISRYKGKALTSASEVEKGAILVTEFYRGQAESIIERIQEEEEDNEQEEGGT